MSSRRPVGPQIGSESLASGLTTSYHESMTNWAELAKCAGTGDKLDYLFFGSSRQFKAAKLFCSDCPVQKECLQYAIDHESVGYIAGTSLEQRQIMAADQELNRRRAKIGSIGRPGSTSYEQTAAELDQLLARLAG